jgi:hypothetical protein
MGWVGIESGYMGSLAAWLLAGLEFWDAVA